jgi:hypothetical protein
MTRSSTPLLQRVFGEPPMPSPWARPGSNPFGTPGGEWTDVKAAPDRVSQTGTTKGVVQNRGRS